MLISCLSRNKRKLLFFKASDKAKSFTRFPLAQQDVYYDFNALLRASNTQMGHYLSGFNSLLRSASRCKHPDCGLSGVVGSWLNGFCSFADE